MKTPLGMEIDLGPVHIVLDGVPALHERGTAAPIFSADVYCGHGRPSQLLLSSFAGKGTCWKIFYLVCKKLHVIITLPGVPWYHAATCVSYRLSFTDARVKWFFDTLPHVCYGAREIWWHVSDTLFVSATTHYFFKKYCVVASLSQHITFWVTIKHIIFQKILCCAPCPQHNFF